MSPNFRAFYAGRAGECGSYTVRLAACILSHGSLEVDGLPRRVRDPLPLCGRLASPEVYLSREHREPAPDLLKIFYCRTG